MEPIDETKTTKLCTLLNGEECVQKKPLGLCTLDLDVFEKVILTLAKQVPTLETVITRN